jgi:hypothetical protein
LRAGKHDLSLALLFRHKGLSQPSNVPRSNLWRKELDIAVEQCSFESMRGSFKPQRSNQIASGAMTISGDPCTNAAPLLPRQRITAPVVDIHHPYVI